LNFTLTPTSQDDPDLRAALLISKAEATEQKSLSNAFSAVSKQGRDKIPEADMELEDDDDDLR
jgi:hypothetical protein